MYNFVKLNEYFLFFKKKIMYLFLAALDLGCCPWAPSRCGVQAQGLWPVGLVALVESCWTRGHTCVLYIGRRILNQPLNHQESPSIFFLKLF